MRKISTLGLSMAILAATGWLAQASAQAAPDNSAPAPSSDSSTPAPADSSAAPAKPMHKHHTPKGIHRGTATKGDAAVEDLNAQSLSAAKSGTAFKPATTPTPDKAPMKGKGMKPMHHHHKKAAAAPAADSSAPAPDAAAPAPDSGSK